VKAIKVISVRGDVIETEEMVFCAVFDGRWHSFGDVKRYQHFRSAAKPLQALMLVKSGAADVFKLESRHISIAAASHSGTSLHAETVLDMLKRAGLDETYLDCGTHQPPDAEASFELLRKSEKPSPLRHNCSGKHAAMLLTSKHLGYPLKNYRKPDHPLQKELHRITAVFCGVKQEEVKTASDGCGVVDFAVPLKSMVTAYRKLIHPPREWHIAAERVLNAISEAPVHFAGETTMPTEVVRLTKGRVIVKGGAEGLFCGIEREKGFAFALKVVSGEHKIPQKRRTPVTSACVAAVSIMRNFRFISEKEASQLQEFLKPVLHNHHGEVVGQAYTVFP